MTSASSATGLNLDPSNSEDAKIMRRQQQVARQAGRDGLDRAKTTRGRHDLEGAYDAGAGESAGAHFRPYKADEAEPTKAPRGKGGGKSTGSRPTAPGSSQASAGPSWSQLKPTSPARPPRRLADAGGFLTGIGLYMVVVIYVRYGAEGWKGWLSAKFLNKPMANGNQSASDKPKNKNGGSRAV